VLELLDRVIDGSNAQDPVFGLYPGDDLLTPLTRRVGLPIGNLTSQFFANLYLDPLDQFVKRELRCRAYLRYSDDFLLFADDKARLHDWRAAIVERLEGLRLRLHEGKSQVRPVDAGITFLGFRHFPAHRRLVRKAVVRQRRRLRCLQAAYAQGRIELAQVRSSIMAWLGHARHANAWQLSEAMLAETPFSRGAESSAMEGCGR